MSEAERLADAIDPLKRKSLDNLTCAVAAALLRSQAAEIERLTNINADLCAKTNALTIQSAKDAAERDALRAALIWYRDEAAALHKYVESGAHTNAVLASVTVLALDAGARADAAIDAARQS